MSRSSNKGPFVDPKLLAKIEKLASSGNRNPIKTWSRNCQVAPEFVGNKFLVHNGRHFIEVLITEDMVGHRLGEFAPSRTFRGHGQVVKRTMDKT